MHFSFASKSLSTYIALTVSTMLRGGVTVTLAVTGAGTTTDVKNYVVSP